MRKILLIALLLSGMISSAQNSITDGPCKAFFKYEVNNKLMNPLPGTAINFYDLSEGKAYAWFWDFGDGIRSEEQNPMHIFTMAMGGPNVEPNPFRRVSLTILTSDTCKSLYSEIINIMDGSPYIGPSCKSGFKYYQTAFDLTVGSASFQLTNLSEGDSLSYFWKFDNGTTSNEKEPIVTFDIKPADHQVCLTVTGVNNCTDTFCDNVYISNPGDTIINPAKCETVFGYEVNKDIKTFAPALVLNFYSKASPDASGWTWDFGDGTTSNEQNPTHIFNFPLGNDSISGNKDLLRKVCLTVKTISGCVANHCEAINIYMNTNPPGEPDSTKCYTAFGYMPNFKIQTFAPALVLDFYSKVTPDIIEWTWDFGDGTSDNEQNPTHIFNLPLSKDSVLGDPNPFRKVCLTVKTVSGCVANYCETINIYMNTTPPDPVLQCHAWFKYNKAIDVISIPEVIPYRLWDVSEGKVIRRLWQFENGTTSTEAEPLVSFDFLKPTQKVCLTVYTADSCTSTWCETIQVSEIKPDTVYTGKLSNSYSMHYISSFPPQMSSCAGYVKAEVFRNDTVIEADNYVWSNGKTGQEVNGLCPTQIYTVKATTADGTVVSGTFVFNADGSVTEAPYNWWVIGVKNNPLLRDYLYNQYTVEWKLCDGTIINSDSIPHNSSNCGTEDATLILKDASGNVIYSENISMKTFTTGLDPNLASSPVKLFPNPVNDVLNIQYAGNNLNMLQIDVFDISGKTVSSQKLFNIETGQTISLNVNSLRKGIYLCKIISEKQVIGIEKFVK